MRGADRVGIKIAPGFTVNDTFDDNPAETYIRSAMQWTSCIERKKPTWAPLRVRTRRLIH